MSVVVTRWSRRLHDYVVLSGRRHDLLAYNDRSRRRLFYLDQFVSWVQFDWRAVSIDQVNYALFVVDFAPVRHYWPIVVVVVVARLDYGRRLTVAVYYVRIRARLDKSNLFASQWRR